MDKAHEQEGSIFELYMNYFQIYMENLTDLLQMNKAAENLKFRGNNILNAETVPVNSPEDIFGYI